MEDEGCWVMLGDCLVPAGVKTSVSWEVAAAGILLTVVGIVAEVVSWEMIGGRDVGGVASERRCTAVLVSPAIVLGAVLRLDALLAAAEGEEGASIPTPSPHLLLAAQTLL